MVRLKWHIDETARIAARRVKTGDGDGLLFKTAMSRY